ncbi:MAG TPA: response regulator [Gemmataceae bacterium]|nr:response regulator [Gemmataceae bacterium]
MPTVLVVDDSAVDRRLAGALLEKHCACSLAYAEDGQDALRQMARQRPDLVVTDLQMPEMDGLELTTTIKSEYPLVPVVLMTAQGSEEIAAQALRRGAASYVPKRNLAEALVPTVLRILLGSQEDRAHSQLMHHLEHCESVFVLDNDPGLIGALVSHLQQLLRCLPLADETDRLRVGVALEEALTNACYHGNLEVGSTADRRAREELAERRRWEEPYRDRRIHVLARLSRSQAVFVVRDEGPGFDVSALPAADVLSAERESGRGVTLMRALMDEVAYNAAGNEVTLTKRRAPEPAPDEADTAG